MLTIGKEHAVSFDVTVMGTSAEPSVRLILATTPELSFPASKVGESWVSKCMVPIGVTPGDYDLRVEVVVNNRLFSPTSKRIQVVSPEPIEPVRFEPKVSAPAPAPAEQPSLLKSIVAEPPRSIGETTKKDVAQLADDITFKPSEFKAPSLSTIIKTYETGSMSALRRVAERKVTPLPKPGSVEKTDVSVSLAQVAAIAEKIEPPKKKRTKPQPVVEVKATLPIRLVKGDIIYE